MGLAMMGGGESIKVGGWTAPEAETVDVPAESLHEAAGRLVSKLEGLESHLARIDRSNGPLHLGVPKSSEQPGLEALLERCHQIASGLDRQLDRLATRIGPL